MNIRSSALITFWIAGLLLFAPNATLAQFPSMPSSPVTSPSIQNINPIAIPTLETCRSGEQRNDKILFSRSNGLFAINRDGSNARELVHEELGVSGFHTAWSHQGDKIVYSAFRNYSPGRFNVYTINANGTDRQNITADLPASYFGGDFSLDDRKVVFFGWEPPARARVDELGEVDVSIMVKNLESGTVATIASLDVSESLPRLWSAHFMTPPNWCSTDEITFMEPHTTFQGWGRWFNLVSANGTDLGTLGGSGGIYSNPNCGGRGNEEKMVYTEYETMPSGGIFQNGAHLGILPHPHRDDIGFSLPNASKGVINHQGTKVAYLTAPTDSMPGSIRVADLEDRGENPGLEISCGLHIFPLNLYPNHAVWSPDDQQVAFEAYDANDPTPLNDTDSTIYVANIDGSGCRPLTVGRLHNWSPLKCTRMVGIQNQTLQPRPQPLQLIRPRKQSGKK